MGGETNYCPSETCGARNPPKILAIVRPHCGLLHFLHSLFMDEEVDELGDGLEDLEIEIGVEFLYYAELYETFWRIKKLLESEILLVAGLSFSDCIAFILKLNTPTQHHCKDFLYRIVMSARCKFCTARHRNNQTVAPKAGKTISHRIAGL